MIIKKSNVLLGSLCSLAITASTGFSMLSSNGRPCISLQMAGLGDVDVKDSDKRGLLIASGSIFASVLCPSVSHADIEGVATPSTADPNPSKTRDTTGNGAEGVTLYTTKSGLKYIDIKEGTGPSPRYGQLCSISYKAYVKLPDKSDKKSKLDEYDSDNGYLIKHGNGRMIPGLDEGLHTLKVGGKRRLIIPPKLGYVGPGVLGPLPEGPLGRYKLNKLLNEMVEVRGGNVVFDVELRSVIDDEADQGYYEDASLTPEDFNTLRENLQAKASQAKAEGRRGVDILSAVEQ